MAVNIYEHWLYRDYAKIGVTEKSYDFVTFYIKINYIMTTIVLCQVFSDGTKKSGIGIPSYNTNIL